MKRKHKNGNSIIEILSNNDSLMNYISTTTKESLADNVSSLCSNNEFKISSISLSSSIRLMLAFIEFHENKAGLSKGNVPMESIKIVISSIITISVNDEEPRFPSESLVLSEEIIQRTKFLLKCVRISHFFVRSLTVKLLEALIKCNISPSEAVQALLGLAVQHPQSTAFNHLYATVSDWLLHLHKLSSHDSFTSYCKELLRLVAVVISNSNSSTKGNTEPLHLTASAHILRAVVMHCHDTTDCLLLMWDELWQLIGPRPTPPLKLLSLKIVQYASRYRPEALHVLLQGSRFSLANTSDVNKSNVTAVDTTSSSNNVDKHPHPHSLPHAPLLVAASLWDKDSSIRINATQLLIDDIIKYREELPPSCWDAVFVCISSLLSGEDPASNLTNNPTPVQTAKGVQYSALNLLHSLLANDLFRRQFPLICTRAQSLRMICDDLVVLEDSHKNEDLISFLHHEHRFQSNLHQYCLPGVYALIEKASVVGIANRTVGSIEKLLRSRYIGIDPVRLLACLEVAPEELQVMLVRVVNERCCSMEAVLELCESAISTFVDNCTTDMDLLSQPSVLRSRQLIGILSSESVGLGVGAGVVDKNRSKDIDYIILMLYGEITKLVNNGSNLCEMVKIDTDSNDKEATLSAKRRMSLLLACIEMSSKSPAALLPACDFLLASLDPLTQLAVASPMIAKELSVWLQVLCSPAETGLLSANQLALITRVVYPSMLANSYVMSSAVALALRLPSAMSLLFTSLGFLQDAAFSPSHGQGSDAEAVVQYVNLIAAVIRENAKKIKADIWGDSSLFKLRRLAKPNAVEDENIYEEDAMDNDTNPNEGNLENNTDYMCSARTDELCRAAECDALECSVSGPDSFLSCFLPMIAKLATVSSSTGTLGLGSVPVAVVMASLRCLGEYMKCSASLLKGYLGLLESMLVCDTNERTSAECMFTWSVTYPCRMEALAVWLSVFRPGLSDTAVLVGQLVRTVLMRSDLGTSSHAEDDDSLLPQLDSFIRALQCCLASLIIDGKVKDSTDIALSLVIPLLASTEVDENLRFSHTIHGCADILMRTLCFDPRLVGRLLFRLCSTGEGSGEDGDKGKPLRRGRREPASISATLVSYFNMAASMDKCGPSSSASANRGRQFDGIDSDTGSLLEAAGGESGDVCHRRVVAMRLVLDLVKGGDVLACKLVDVERSAVQEVLRSGSVHVAELVDLLDASEEMANLIDQALQGGSGTTLLTKVTTILGRHALKAKSVSTKARRPARGTRLSKGQKTASTRTITTDELDEDEDNEDD